jgi:cation transport ATPase
MGVLTAGSPCAVVLVPLAYVCSIATITRKGVIVKSAQAVDALLNCRTVALDKTGGWPHMISGNDDELDA